MAEGQFRRQFATILSIDAVGFSQLMGMNDEEALGAFRERAGLIMRECETAGGRMFGMAGDSLMAEFGNPADAVRAALAFQHALETLNAEAPETRRMPFRVGINTGDVIVEGDRLFGHDVNIAARLQEKADPHGVVVSATTWQHVNGRLAAEFVELGTFALKNMREPIRAFQALRPGESRKTQVSNGGAKAAGATGTVPPQQPSVAILPFANQIGDGDLDYLGEAISEDIILGLSNMRWLPVISGASSRQFIDGELAPSAAGRSLGARYVVSGRLTRAAESLRLAVTMEESANGRVIWSRRFDRPESQARELQDAAGIELVAILGGEVDRAEQARTFQIPWEDLQTWQLLARGRFHMARRTSADTALALDFFTRAHERDPNASTVLSELAWWHFWQGFVSLEPHHFEKTTAYAHKALFMDSQDARPHAYLGATAVMSLKPEEGRAHLENALRINPSFAFASSCLGSVRSLLGDPAAAIPMFRDAERLSPFDLYQFHNQGELAAAHTALGNWEEASAMADKSLALSPGYWYARALKTGALVRLGRMQEAREQRAILFERYPNFNTERIAWIPFRDRSVTKTIIENFEAAAG
ncbi:MAG: adenylate/guanylate cyclase domain-containing protein [Notoacmeibacter sp.]|nr:adenylate/guanylate cyclase domain-containing protein [Notoacmeibacter sp.]